MKKLLLTVSCAIAALTTNAQVSCTGVTPVITTCVKSFCATPASVRLKNESFGASASTYYYYLFEGSTRINTMDSSYTMGYPSDSTTLHTLNTTGAHTYTLMVTNGITCMDTVTVTVMVQNVPPMVINKPTLIKKAYSTIKTWNNVNDSCIGSVKINTAAITGGVPAYKFHWYNASKVFMFTTTSDSITNLCKGIYYFKVTDSNTSPCTGCSGSGSSTVTGLDTNFYDVEIGFPLTCSSNMIPFSTACTGQVDLFFNSSDGVAPYNLVALDNSFTNGAMNTYVFGNSPSFVFLSPMGAGMFSYTITDANGEQCSAMSLYYDNTNYTPLTTAQVTSATNFVYTGSTVSFDVTILLNNGNYPAGNNNNLTLLYVSGNYSGGYGNNSPIINGIYTNNITIDTTQFNGCVNLFVINNLCNNIQVPAGQVCLPTPTSLNLINNSSASVISPNPNNGTFTISTTTQGTYSIVNELGQAVRTFTTTNNTTTVTGLASGMYVLIGNNGNSITRTKIVVTE
ncbi:MAG: T9SS type A sorting domain-containing protein [Bacteroidia bacterium]